MKTILKFLMLTGLLIASHAGYAQSLASAEDPGQRFEQIGNQASEEFLNPQDAFFLDLGEKVCFIDFQALTINVKAVQLQSAEGDLLLEDHVDHLPVNSIYEMNLTDLPSGRYRILIQGYTETIQKSFAF